MKLSNVRTAHPHTHTTNVHNSIALPLSVCVCGICWVCHQPRGISAAERQEQIVQLGGLQLLLPLTKSKNIEVQRLAAHALANLSVNCKFCVSPQQHVPLLHRGCRPCPLPALLCPPTHTTHTYKRRAGEPYAAADNQETMAKQGGIEMLIGLLGSTSEPVQRQSAKALANLGVNRMLLCPSVCVLCSPIKQLT